MISGPAGRVQADTSCPPGPAVLPAARVVGKSASLWVQGYLQGRLQLLSQRGRICFQNFLKTAIDMVASSQPPHTSPFLKDLSDQVRLTQDNVHFDYSKAGDY